MSMRGESERCCITIRCQKIKRFVERCNGQLYTSTTIHTLIRGIKEHLQSCVGCADTVFRDDAFTIKVCQTRALLAVSERLVIFNDESSVYPALSRLVFENCHVFLFGEGVRLFRQPLAAVFAFTLSPTKVCLGVEGNYTITNNR